MDPDINLVGAGISFDQVQPIHQKRTLAFINFWLSRTATFLGSFATHCDEKLETLERKLEHVDAALTLLEAKLQSIPGFDEERPIANGVDANGDAPVDPKPTPPTAPPITVVPSAPTVPVAPPTAAVDNSHKIAIKEHPDYQKYFKMLKMGVPAVAVKLKMNGEGMDPDMLDDADKLVDKPREAEDSESDLDSDSSFSSDL